MDPEEVTAIRGPVADLSSIFSMSPTLKVAKTAGSGEIMLVLIETFWQSDGDEAPPLPESPPPLLFPDIVENLSVNRTSV
jgi:hypothetical protein